MPRKKAKEVDASVEETQPVNEETPEAEEKPEVPAEEVPKTEQAEEAPEEIEEAPEEIEEAPEEIKAAPGEPPKAELKVPGIPGAVSINSLTAGAEFEYQGKLYQKRNSTAAVVSGLDLKESVRRQQEVWKAFPPATLVIPK